MINVYGYFFMVVMALCVLFEKSQICLCARFRQNPKWPKLISVYSFLRSSWAVKLALLLCCLPSKVLLQKQQKKHEVSSVILEALEADLEF